MNKNLKSGQSNREMAGAPMICVAAIAGAFGVRGEVKIKSFTEEPAACLGYGPLCDMSGNVILTPIASRFVKKFLAVKSQEIRSREAAEALKSTRLYVPRAVLPATQEDEFYYTDLIGLRVVSDDGLDQGTVKAVHDFGGGDLLEIKPAKGPSWFHPFTRDAVPEVNINGGQIVITIVEADEAVAPSENEA